MLGKTLGKIGHIMELSGSTNHLQWYVTCTSS